MFYIIQIRGIPRTLIKLRSYSPHSYSTIFNLLLVVVVAVQRDVRKYKTNKRTTMALRSQHLGVRRAVGRISWSHLEVAAILCTQTVINTSPADGLAEAIWSFRRGTVKLHNFRRNALISATCWWNGDTLD